jgi:hypothetical protein
LSEALTAGRLGTPVGANAEWPRAWRDRGEVLRLAELGLAELMRHLARSSGNGRILDADGLLLFAGARAEPSVLRNGAIRVGRRLSGAEMLDRAAEFFAPLRRSFAVWSREDDEDIDAVCRARGLQSGPGFHGLYLEGAPDTPHAPAAGGVLRRTKDAEARRAYATIAASGEEREGAEAADPHVIAFVAYADGVPASACMALPVNGIAVMAGTTTSRTRESGLVEACHRACLETASVELGIHGSVCHVPSADSSDYERMGYRAFTRYEHFTGPTNAWE